MIRSVKTAAPVPIQGSDVALHAQDPEQLHSFASPPEGPSAG